MKNELWVILADQAQAKIFSLKRTMVVQRHVFVNPEGRKKGRDFTSDRVGRSGRQGSGQAHVVNSMGGGGDPVIHREEIFLKGVADYLDKSNAQGLFSRVALFAESHAMGMLKKHLSKDTQKKIVFTLSKNLGHLKEKPLFTYIKNAAPSLLMFPESDIRSLGQGTVMKVPSEEGALGRTLKGGGMAKRNKGSVHGRRSRHR